MSGGLKGKHALVTGGTRGLGWAIAQRMVADGALVVATGTRVDGRGPEGASYEAVDFLDNVAFDAFLAELRQRTFHILVNNAGINEIGPFGDLPPEIFDRVHRVNQRAPALLCQAVLPGMRAAGWGRIINIGSVFGVVSRALRGPYSATKFGLRGLTSALAAEVVGEGILVNCVAPGFIDTDLTRDILGEDGIEELLSQVPARRLGKPEEVAALVAWLAGPENTYISGQTLVIDGGFTSV